MVQAALGSKLQDFASSHLGTQDESALQATTISGRKDVLLIHLQGSSQQRFFPGAILYLPLYLLSPPPPHQPEPLREPRHPTTKHRFLGLSPFRAFLVHSLDHPLPMTVLSINLPGAFCLPSHPLPALSFSRSASQGPSQRSAPLLERLICRASSYEDSEKLLYKPELAEARLCDCALDIPPVIIRDTHPTLATGTDFARQLSEEKTET